MTNGGVMTANGDTQAAGERLLTADELAQMSGDGDRYELLDGELMISPRPSPLHRGLIISSPSRSS